MWTILLGSKMAERAIEELPEVDNEREERYVGDHSSMARTAFLLSSGIEHVHATISVQCHESPCGCSMQQHGPQA
jgi:hypothetical protein